MRVQDAAAHLCNSGAVSDSRAPEPSWLGALSPQMRRLIDAHPLRQAAIGALDEAFDTWRRNGPGNNIEIDDVALQGFLEGFVG